MEKIRDDNNIKRKSSFFVNEMGNEKRGGGNMVKNELPIQNNNDNSQMKNKSYASIVSLNLESSTSVTGYQFKNLLYKDSRSDSYIKRGIWWFRATGLTVNNYKKYLIDKYGVDAIEIVLQISFRKIEAYVKNEILALQMSNDEIEINGTRTKIRLINTAPQRICIRNVMPWVTAEEVVSSLSAFGEVIKETIEFMMHNDNEGNMSKIYSGTVVLVIHRNGYTLPQYFSPKIGGDFHRWYLAPMTVKCFNCDAYGHWVRYCGNDHDLEKINDEIKKKRR